MSYLFYPRSSVGSFVPIFRRFVPICELFVIVCEWFVSICEWFVPICEWFVIILMGYHLFLGICTIPEVHMFFLEVLIQFCYFNRVSPNFEVFVILFTCKGSYSNSILHIFKVFGLIQKFKCKICSYL